MGSDSNYKRWNAAAETERSNSIARTLFRLDAGGGKPRARVGANRRPEVSSLARQWPGSQIELLAGQGRILISL